LFIITVVFILIYYIIIPTLKLIKLGNTISHQEAAKIIGDHFPEVSDKLLNTLQLSGSGNTSNMELLLASIEQKSSDLKSVPFRNAVNIK